MPLMLDSTCQGAIDLAKRALVDGAPLDAPLLLAALYRQSDLKTAYPELEACLPALEMRHRRR